LKDKPVLAILNKGDLEEKIEKDEIYKTFSHVTELTAKDPESLKTLSQAVSDFLGTSGFDADAPLLANERQRGCAQRARQAVKDALEGVEIGLTLDVCYALLDEALAALYDLSGENASEEVINAVFDRFCVGK
ncbi:MAG: tRNA uridine-5-carboxymethylaminomethyl(34) synthesis GTPase MnmE, partial [Oscillospiraceae bacterium]|nr:tRNA uridine-5-carboxymethylaminomethyl(34) synthesis GTPase MnmE [Oscillospiraceae bacterium]